MQGNMGIYTPAVGEGHITILPWHYSAITAGTWSFQLYSAEFFYGCWTNAGATGNLDQIDYKVYFDTGTYTITILARKGPQEAIYDLLLDGASQGTKDQYAVGWSYNVITSWTALAITKGLRTLSLKANGHSGADYYVQFQSISIYRTA